MPPAKYPNSPVFFRKLTQPMPRIVRAEGVYLYDDEGKRYLDGSGGAFVVNTGHGVREIADALSTQAQKIAYVSGTAFTHEPSEKMAAALAERAPGDLEYAYFLASGSEAVEAALKLARQYWVETGRPEKHKVLALAPGYHGNTLLALSASARPHYKTLFGDWLVDVRLVPAPYSYRCACRGKGTPCDSCSGAALEKAILEEGPDTVAAFIGEPIGGSSTGASVPRPDYWRRVKEICARHHVLWIADEIACGAGRTGTWSALEPYGVAPDIMTLGKGITGGYAPLSAMLAPRRLVDPIAQGSGALMHAQTFSHHAVLCAAGVATLAYIDKNDLVARCAAMGAVLHRKLEQLRSLPHVGDVRGRGLFAGVEFVEDTETRAPFPRALKFAEHFTDHARKLGLVVWPNIGQADNTNGDLVMIAPPFVITEAQIDELVDLFSRALTATVAEAPAAVGHG